MQAGEQTGEFGSDERNGTVDRASELASERTDGSGRDTCACTHAAL